MVLEKWVRAYIVSRGFLGGFLKLLQLNKILSKREVRSNHVDADVCNTVRRYFL